MRRILHEVGRWHLYLHREGRDLPAAHEDDPARRRLEDELFEKLYAGEVEALLPGDVDAQHADWARQLHATTEALPDFARLAQQVRGDPLMAALATEQLVSQFPEDQRSPQLRKQVAAGCKRAADAVDEAREMLDGVGGVGAGACGSTDSIVSARKLLRRLHEDPRLKRIAAMAGRFRRIAAGRMRQRIEGGAEEICDIERGSDLGRLLPTELARLNHPKLKLAFLRDLHERSAMQYALRGPEPMGKGPLVVCLDRSGSMDGPRDEWSAAAALALLEVAQRERRPFAVIAFDSGVTLRVVVPVGHALPQEALMLGCSGGTNIDAAIEAALDVIRMESPVLRRADIVLITDGYSEPTRAAELREQAQVLGVSILGLGIGVEAQLLRPWCDEVEAITNLDEPPESIGC